MNIAWAKYSVVEVLNPLGRFGSKQQNLTRISLEKGVGGVFS